MHRTRSSSTPVEHMDKDTTGKIAKICGCLNHESFSCGKQFTIFGLKKKKFKNSTIEILHQKDLLSRRKQYLCTACAEFAEEKWGLFEPLIKKSKYHVQDYVSRGLLNKLRQ